jgi:hypothetical protein
MPSAPIARLNPRSTRELNFAGNSGISGSVSPGATSTKLWTTGSNKFSSLADPFWIPENWQLMARANKSIWGGMSPTTTISAVRSLSLWVQERLLSSSHLLGERRWVLGPRIEFSTRHPERVTPSTRTIMKSIWLKKSLKARRCAWRDRGFRHFWAHAQKCARE